MSMEHLSPHVGDIWREVDPRFSRHVLIIADHGGPPDTVQIQACYRKPETIGWQVYGPRRWASLKRFTGRRGGYAFCHGASKLCKVHGVMHDYSDSASGNHDV